MRKHTPDQQETGTSTIKDVEQQRVEEFADACGQGYTPELAREWVARADARRAEASLKR